MIIIIIIFNPKALQCNNLWYEFVLPDDFEMHNNYDVSGGQTYKFSELCNEYFVASDGYNCAQHAEYGFCQDNAFEMVYYATENTDGIWETGLQCPQCGCGDDGAVNLNDLYAADGDRTVSNREPRKKN